MTYGLPDSFIYGTYKRLSRGSSRGRGGRGGFSFPRYDYYLDKVVFTPGALDLLLNEETGTVGRHLNKIAMHIKREAIKQVGKETGSLAKSIQWDYERTSTGQARRIYADHRLAMIHHEGTRPHYIAPNDGKILKFRAKGGSMVFTDQVLHPGTQPNRFLSDQLPYVSTYLGMLSQR